MDKQHTLMNKDGTVQPADEIVAGWVMHEKVQRARWNTAASSRRSIIEQPYHGGATFTRIQASRQILPGHYRGEQIGIAPHRGNDIPLWVAHHRASRSAVQTAMASWPSLTGSVQRTLSVTACFAH